MAGKPCVPSVPGEGQCPEPRRHGARPEGAPVGRGPDDAVGLGVGADAEGDPEGPVGEGRVRAEVEQARVGGEDADGMVVWKRKECMGLYT